MADQKISQLTAATTPLSGTEVLPIVQSGVTKQVSNNDLRPKQIQSNATSGVLQVVGPAAAATRVMTVPDANFTAARTDAAQTLTGNQTITNGNMVMSNGYGVSFAATPGTGTSELFSDYEEGTWTPAFNTGSGQSVTYSSQTGKYTKIGRDVFCQGVIDIGSAATWGSSTHFQLSGLPFAVNSYIDGISFSYGGYYGSNSLFQVGDITGAQATGSGATNIYLQRGQYGGTSDVYYRVALLNTTGLVTFTIEYTV